MTTTTAAVAATATVIPVTSANGIKDDVSTVSGIGINSASTMTVTNISSLNLTVRALVAANNEALENGQTVTFTGSSRSGTITADVKVLQYGDSNITLTLNLDNHSEPGSVKFEYGNMIGDSASFPSSYGRNDGIVGISYGTSSSFDGSTTPANTINYLNINDSDFLHPNVPVQQFLDTVAGSGTGTDQLANKTITFRGNVKFYSVARSAAKQHYSAGRTNP